MDLEHSFGPAYVRGRLLRGTAADAVIGVSEAESSATIDGILTLGILWLDYCREHSDPRRHFGGLKVIMPRGASKTAAERMAWLNHAAAEFQLYTLDERSEELEPVDFRDIGNQTARLVHSFSPEAAFERCRAGIDRIMQLLPEGAQSRVEIRHRSRVKAIFLAARSPSFRPACSSPHRYCAFTRRICQSCAMFRRKSTGSSSLSEHWRHELKIVFRRRPER